ncbi:MaoC/PaaZ C-terminal domain-containing protein [Microbacterium alcoholitolerans]|uniref:MaoC/PaaZ C-terminal domain-containing protein n=1 Tax=unclassified Microbacterium TaxID=2609290 RepID=UPI003D171BA2
MAVDPHAVGRSTNPRRYVWTSRDAMLYALGVGAGAGELAFVTENSHNVEQRVLPTYAVIVADASAALPLIGDIDLSRLVHGAQSLRLHRPLPPGGAVDSTASVVSIVDKGPGGNAVVELSARAVDATTGELMAETRSTVVLRGGGGFGGESGARAHPPEIPERTADAEITERIQPEQALLYRLSGDRNPLHSDPWFARERAGFPKPILHGLCTYGFAGRALLSEVCDGEDPRFAEMSASFTAPVFPEETLTTAIWRTSASEALFRTYAQTGDADPRIVLDGGRVRLR